MANEVMFRGFSHLNNGDANKHEIFVVYAILLICRVSACGSHARSFL